MKSPKREQQQQKIKTCTGKQNSGQFGRASIVSCGEEQNNQLENDIRQSQQGYKRRGCIWIGNFVGCTIVNVTNVPTEAETIASPEYLMRGAHDTAVLGARPAQLCAILSTIPNAVSL